MDVSIIFVNYKTKDLTINAINSVIEKTEGVDYEIFVVDNASNDGSIEAIEQEFSNINIIKNPINSGFGSANNLAIKQAKGKYIFCLNTDTLLVNNAIKIMFDFMEKKENSKIDNYDKYLTLCIICCLLTVLSLYMYWMWRFAAFCYFPIFVFAANMYKNDTNHDRKAIYLFLLVSSLFALNLKLLIQYYFIYGGIV